MKFNESTVWDEDDATACSGAVSIVVESDRNFETEISSEQIEEDEAL